MNVNVPIIAQGIDGSIVPVRPGLANLATEIVVRFDDGTFGNAVIQMGSEHYRIHRGKMFSAASIFKAIADNGVIDIAFVSGANDVHVTVLQYATNGNGQVDFYPAPTLTGGTPLPVINRNANYATIAPAAAIMHTPTVTATGLLAESFFLPGGAGGGRTGSIMSSDAEYILKANAKTLLRYTNLGGNGGIYNPTIVFYEVSLA